MERASSRSSTSAAPDHGAAARRRRARHACRRRQAAAAAARVHLRRGRGDARQRWCGPRRPSSWSTWRPSSTTTSSTTRRCAGAGRRCSRAAGRGLATATGDFLFSRAFALLAANGERGAGAGALGCLPSRWRAESSRSAQDAYAADVDARALPAPLRAEDGEPVRGRLPAGRAGGRPAPGARSRALERVRPAGRPRLPAARRRARRQRAAPSAPASTAAPTCSTARSRCR